MSCEYRAKRYMVDAVHYTNKWACFRGLTMKKYFLGYEICKNNLRVLFRTSNFTLECIWTTTRTPCFRGQDSTERYRDVRGSQDWFTRSLLQHQGIESLKTTGSRKKCATKCSSHCLAPVSEVLAKIGYNCPHPG